MKTLLITGGAGYIGSHTVAKLTANGYDCVVLDNLSYGHRDAVKNVPFVQLDLREKGKLDAIFHQYDFDAVLHFAGVTYVGESVENPQKYYDNNVIGTFNLLRTMQAHHVNKIVFSSSCAVYGEPEKLPLDETHPLLPLSPYGQTKAIVEKMLADYHKAYGLSYVALRYFNAAGADEKALIGESHDPETHIIPLVLQTILNKRPTVTVFGQDYPTPDGTCLRDYVHVNDLATAHMSALESDFVGCLNLGTGRGYSVREIIDMCENVSGKKCPVIFGPRRQGDAPALYADARKAREVLNWIPEKTSLRDMIETAWRWEQNRAF